MQHILTFLLILIGVPALAQDAVEAAAGCVVIHEQGNLENNKLMTCFENISLERSAFESGVCQWKSEAQASTDVQSTTRFVAHCPTPYAAYCDRLVLGPGVVAPVKIFLYDDSEEVLARARGTCLGGGGKWSAGDKDD